MPRRQNDRKGEAEGQAVVLVLCRRLRVPSFAVVVHGFSFLDGSDRRRQTMVSVRHAASMLDSLGPADTQSQDHIRRYQSLSKSKRHPSKQHGDRGCDISFSDRALVSEGGRDRTMRLLRKPHRLELRR